MSNTSNSFLAVFLCCIPFTAHAQKKVNNQSLFWLGSVNTIRFNEHWGMVADFHYRTYDFMSHPYSYIARGQASYYFNENLTAGAGYGHACTGPFDGPSHLYSNENRIFEAVRLNSKKGKFTMANRWMFEQRWQQKIVNNKKTDDYRFTNRARYALAFMYTPFKNRMLPAFTNYEEVMVQFGKEVVYNTFDQARFSFGIRQNITRHINIDLNYLYGWQQQFSGNQYLQVDVLRFYINYMVGWKKKDDPKKSSAFIEKDE